MTFAGWRPMVQASIVTRQRLAVAVDDVAALGRQVDRAALAPGMVAERREVDQAEQR